MKRYDSYKDSGVKWLGEIPSHWEVKRLGSYFTERRVKVSDEEYEPLSVTKLGVFTQWENVAKSNDGDNRKLVKRGDFVINSRSDRKGSSGVSDRDGSVSLINIVLQPRKTIIAGYTNYLLKSYQFIEEYYRNGRGIVADLWTTRFEEMKMIKVAIPSIKEQEAIANYLDTATSKIDEAIAQQQKMIDLLNERKQIIINNAVTKGLDPNVKMKPSGIDWIGMIPEGWEVLRIKNLISLLTDYDANGSFSDIAKNCNINVGVPFAWMVRTTDLVNKRYGIVDGNNFCDQKTYNYLAKSSLCSGDLLMTKRGNVGNVYVVPDCDQPMTLAPNLYLLRTLKNKVNNKYLVYYLSSSKPQGQLALLNKSTTLGALYKDDVKGLNVVIPPLNVQNILVDWIEKKCHDVDAAIDNIKKQISLLQERKQIIINDVVTGKVKVV